MVAPWLHDAEIVRQVCGGEEEVKERSARACRARVRFETDGFVEYVPAVSTSDPNAAMYGADDCYLDPKRGAIPAWSNRFATMAWKEWLEYDAIAAAPRVTQPALIVHSDCGAVPEGARRFASRMKRLPETSWLHGEQFDFYDKPSTVDWASKSAIAHFERTL